MKGKGGINVNTSVKSAGLMVSHNNHGNILVPTPTLGFYNIGLGKRRSYNGIASAQSNSDNIRLALNSCTAKDCCVTKETNRAERQIRNENNRLEKQVLNKPDVKKIRFIKKISRERHSSKKKSSIIKKPSIERSESQLLIAHSGEKQISLKGINRIESQELGDYYKRTLTKHICEVNKPSGNKFNGTLMTYKGQIGQHRQRGLYNCIAKVKPLLIKVT